MFERLLASKKKPYIKNLNNLDKVSFNLSGTQLKLELPPNDYEIAEYQASDHVNINDEVSFDYGLPVQKFRQSN